MTKTLTISSGAASAEQGDAPCVAEGLCGNKRAAHGEECVPGAEQRDAGRAELREGLKPYLHRRSGALVSGDHQPQHQQCWCDGGGADQSRKRLRSNNMTPNGPLESAPQRCALEEMAASSADCKWTMEESVRLAPYSCPICPGACESAAETRRSDQERARCRKGFLTAEGRTDTYATTAAPIRRLRRICTAAGVGLAGQKRSARLCRGALRAFRKALLEEYWALIALR